MWKETNIDDWKTFEKNNPASGLNILKKKKYVQHIFQKLIQVAKNNFINNSKRRKRRLAEGLNCLYSFRTENKIKSHKKYVKRYFCGILMSSEKDNILEFNRYMNSDKMPYIIYADLKSLIEK